ncbi:MAG: RluA family pseudouridine synthase [Actinomycetota bacterium]
MTEPPIEPEPAAGSEPPIGSKHAVHDERIPAALAGERVDRVVSLIADVSRREAVDLIAAGAVLLDGGPPEKPSIRVRADASIRIEVAETATGMEPDPSVMFDVVHVDPQVIVVDKPADLVVHPGSGVTGATLANGLLARFPEIESVGETDRPGIVHRLDRGTSGLLMVARTEAAYTSLVAQLAARTVTRRYRSLADGLFESESGLIDAPLGRSLRDATKRAVVADGSPARTHYEVIRRYPTAGVTLIDCVLETGRTHQIRAHLAAIDHPVSGDERYGGEPVAGLDRPFLHAAHLGFEHPATGELLTFDAPLPDDLQTVLDNLDEAEAV